MDHVTEQVRVPAITEMRTWALRAASALALVAVVGSPAAASWHGLVRFGEHELGLSGGWEYLVPISLDGAACYAALLAVRAVLAGDSAIWPRLLTCAYALFSAGFNAHAAVSGPAALFYSLMSLSAVVLWDTTLRALRRDQLRACGFLPGASAHFRLLRWLLAPTETGQAWRGAVLEDIADPTTALAVSRGEVTLPRGRTVTPRDGGTRAIADSTTAEVLEYTPRELPTPSTKADAVRAAFDALGRRDVPAALVWLAERGITVDRSYAYTVSWTPALRAVSGDDR